ncbi:MAG: DNA-directed DNA polymerase I [Parcubacteria group bacterium GW2011_GWA2_45_30]|nr:MAG: DNA-directed DNA polymerase I [Parcubacteria group bacterium GW2011_GWA2_45_30]
MKRLILIDAHAIIHRAYHALPPLTTPAGEPINAVYGFTTILLRILRELKPDYITAAFDMPGPTFRHVAYERYKAQRPETPSELTSQFAKVREVLAAFKIPYFEKAGYEADDIIGTIASHLERNKKIEVVIVTGDADAFQLVRKSLKVYSMRRGITDTVIYDEKAVRERFGLAPRQLVDYKGLRGDPSDNIPGVKGIGEKTATELLKNFNSIEGVYGALKKKDKRISESVAAKLAEGEADAKFSKELARINLDTPIEFQLENSAWKGDILSPDVRVLFQKFGFFSLLKRLGESGDSELRPVTRQEKSVATQGALLEVVARPERARRILKTAKDFENFMADSEQKRLGFILYENNLFAVEDESGAVVVINKPLFREKTVKSILEGKREWYAHDGKGIIQFLRAQAVNICGIYFDTMIAAYLTSQFLRDFSYLAVASRELGRMVSQDAPDEFIHFFEIVSSLEAKLSEGEIRKVFLDIEMPLTPILADMEEKGILFDKKYLQGLSVKIDAELKKLTQEIYHESGEEFNINSSQQLSRILFDKLLLATKGLRKTDKGGVVSTRESELEKLKEKHAIVPKILDYRELMKLKTTYVDTLPLLVDPKTGRLHTTFNQTGTATGRLSSANPNLQNIPIMSDYGKEVRKAFVAEKGFRLVSFDYSQIELRVAAHIANDTKMIEAFQNGLDIHKMTAAEIYNVSLAKVTPELRRAAKTLNFGVLYGMGSQALSEATGMSRDDAKKFIDEYFKKFSGIANYIIETKQFAEEKGYVETIFGRRRYIPEILSPNWQMKREAERMAVNMPVQGTATGDIIKMAMIKIDDWVRKEKLEDKVRMLLQVHDELLFEIKDVTVKKYAPKIKEIMENTAKLKVPLAVDVEMGKNWGEQAPLNQ